MKVPILKLNNISKVFGSVQALDNVSLEVHSGEILAILGENGAGKSTLMKILSGLYQPDGGYIEINLKWFENGEESEELIRRQIQNPRDAMKIGIGMVYQHFQLVEPFTVAENIMLGKEFTKKSIVLDMDKAVDEIGKISKSYGLPIDARRMVEDLPVELKQRVEILKILYRDADLIILDEPTAVLTPKEVDGLFSTMRALKDAGKSIIFISHKLHEPIRIADRIVVIRQGKVVGTADPATITKAELAEMVVGRKIQEQLDRVEFKYEKPIYQIKNLVLKDGEREILHNINLTVHQHEILGIAGVEGNGQSELVEALMGLSKYKMSGNLLIYDKDGNTTELGDKSTLERLNNHIGYIPEDRGLHGLIMDFQVDENIWLGFHGSKDLSQVNKLVDNKTKTNKYILPLQLIENLANFVVKQFNVRTSSIKQSIRNLSGGNQQKVVLGREFAKDPRFIIASQPTRGVDIGVMEQVHEELISRRNEGAGILLISADLDEILKLSDTIAIIYEGHIVDVRPINEYTMDDLSQLMLGGKLEEKTK